MLYFLKNYFIAILNYIFKFFSFKGATSRKEFNMVVLSLPILVLIFLSLLNTFYFKVPLDKVVGIIYVLAIIVEGHLTTSYLIFGAICSIFLLSISVRRLKDLGISPWAVVLILVPGFQLGLLGLLALAPSNALSRTHPPKNKTVAQSFIKRQIKAATDFDSPISHFEFIKKAALAFALQIAGASLGMLIAYLIIKLLNSGVSFRLFHGIPNEMLLLVNAISYALVVGILTYISSIPMTALCIRRAKQLEINTLFAGIASNVFGNILILSLITCKAIIFIFYTDHKLQYSYGSAEPNQLKILTAILIPLAIYFIYLIVYPDKSESKNISVSNEE